MSVIQYKGARYVPKFADPHNWNIDLEYEPLTIVLHAGDSYTSKKKVPAGIDIYNDEYWALTGCFDGQIIELKRRDKENAENISKEITDRKEAVAKEVSERKEAIEKEASERKAADSKLATDIKNEETSRKSEDASLDKKITDLDAYVKKPESVVVFGDSFSASGEWISKITDPRFSIKSYAVNGAAFWKKSTSNWTTIQTQITQERVQNADTVIIYGGVNDWNNEQATSTNTANAIRTCVKLVNTYNPKAKVLLCFGNCGYAQQTQYNGFLQWYQDVLWTLRTNGVKYVDNVCYWHFAVSSAFSSDRLHPNDFGYSIIANFMHQLLEGTYCGVHRSFSTTHLEDPAPEMLSPRTNVYFNLSFDNGIIAANCVTNQTIKLDPQQSGDVSASLGTFIQNGDDLMFSLQFGGNGASAYCNTCRSPITHADVSNTKIGIGDFVFDAGTRTIKLHFMGDHDVTNWTYPVGIGFNWTFQPVVFK